jgi:hypothetical protein
LFAEKPETATAKKLTLLDVLRAVKIYLWDPFSEMIAGLSRGPSRKSRGRRPSIQDEVENLLKEIDQRGT